MEMEMEIDSISNNEVNLCDSCCEQYPSCPQDLKVIFGDGVGNDNVCACNKYDAIAYRDPKR